MSEWVTARCQVCGRCIEPSHQMRQRMKTTGGRGFLFRGAKGDWHHATWPYFPDHKAFPRDKVINEHTVIP